MDAQRRSKTTDVGEISELKWYGHLVKWWQDLEMRFG
jgi:hypothetical protein